MAVKNKSTVILKIDRYCCNLPMTQCYGNVDLLVLQDMFLDKEHFVDSMAKPYIVPEISPPLEKITTALSVMCIYLYMKVRE